MELAVKRRSRYLTLDGAPDDAVTTWIMRRGHKLMFMNQCGPIDTTGMWQASAMVQTRADPQIWVLTINLLPTESLWGLNHNQRRRVRRLARHQM